jgi:outer membrane receptor protein involved in Fe transport
VALFFVGLAPAVAQEGPPPALPGSLSGRVVEKGTKQPLAGASLYLEPAGRTEISDESGRFRFKELPPGSYRLTAAAVNYQKSEPMLLLIHEGREEDLTLYLEREPISMLEIVVETEHKPPDPGRQTLQREEVRKIPGTGGDLLMAVQNLPGVAAATAFQGDFYARGSGPLDNKVLLDQAPVFQTYHFGGFISTINSDIIKTMDFYAGGFGARYGDAMGAVLDITSREGREDFIGSRINLSPVLIEGRVEGPIGEESTFFVAGRRGLIEYLPLPTDEGTTAIPVFNDYQAKLSTDLSDRHELSLLLFGSHDRFIFETDDPDPRDPALTSLNLHLDFHDQAITLRSHHTPQLSSTLTLVNDYHVEDFRIGTDLSGKDLIEDVWLKGHFAYEFPAHTLAAGFEAGHAWYHIDARFIRPCGEGDPGCNVTDQEPFDVDLSDTTHWEGLYLEDILHIASRLDLTLGGRYDYLDAIHDAAAGPRVSALLYLTEDRRIKAAYGYYYQWPEPVQFVEGFGTPDLRLNQAVHYVLGYEQEFSPEVDLDLQVYYKDLDDLVVVSDDPALIYDNEGIGYAEGVEVLIRHRLTDRFFGWAAYGYSVSKRKDHPGEDWRLSDYDRPHTVTLVASYQLTHHWNVGTRWRYSSGAPYTPVVGTSCVDDDCATNGYDPIYDTDINSKRFPPSHRLDFRAEYKETHDTWILTWYFEVWNLYNRRNAIGIDYSDDFSEKEFVTEPGIIPFIGVTVEF